MIATFPAPYHLITSQTALRQTSLANGALRLLVCEEQVTSLIYTALADEVTLLANLASGNIFVLAAFCA